MLCVRCWSSSRWKTVRTKLRRSPFQYRISARRLWVSLCFFLLLGVFPHKSCVQSWDRFFSLFEFHLSLARASCIVNYEIIIVSVLWVHETFEVSFYWFLCVSSIAARTVSRRANKTWRVKELLNSSRAKHDHKINTLRWKMRRVVFQLIRHRGSS